MPADRNGVRRSTTIELLRVSIQSDAFRATLAAEELRRRGPDEAKRAFRPDWSTYPDRRTTQLFLRDAFQAFGEEFAHHLIDVLKTGTQAAVNVASHAFPRLPLVAPKNPADRLWEFAQGRIGNQRLTGWYEILSPIVAVGSAGVTQYASEIVKRADDKRYELCATTLVRMLVQAESEWEADRVVEALVELINDAHKRGWPNPQLMLHRTLPAWRPTSAALDVLLKRCLAPDQPEQLRGLAVDALIEAGDGSLAGTIIDGIETGQIHNAEGLRALMYLGGATAARFVAGATNDLYSIALVLPWAGKLLDDSTIERLKRDPTSAFLVARGLGMLGQSADWIESVLRRPYYLDRGFAGLGLAYARRESARPTLERALKRVTGDGEEAQRERLLLETALVQAGAVEHADSLLERLPRYEALPRDLAKRDIIAALARARGESDPAVVAWQRVAGVCDLDHDAWQRPAPATPPAAKAAVRVSAPTDRAHVGILTIKTEEFEAVLDAFPERRGLVVGRGRRHYNLRITDAGPEGQYTVGIVRHFEQGTGEAQDTARDLLEDLGPELILVVGIAGAAPNSDLTLGDVVISTRVHDYTVEAAKQGGDVEYAISGGPLSKSIAGAVANLQARRDDLGDWTAGLPLQPPVAIDDVNLYGPDEWREKVRASLRHHFAGKDARKPRFVPGVIGSSDRLIKDTDLLFTWLRTARNLLAVEMESGGVYRAARERCSMVAIRGISDVVGFKRDEAWTRYACLSAAAFAKAFLRTGPVPGGVTTAH